MKIHSGFRILKSAGLAGLMLIIMLLSFSAKAQFYNGSQVPFGKNRFKPSVIPVNILQSLNQPDQVSRVKCAVNESFQPSEITGSGRRYKIEGCTVHPVHQTVGTFYD